MSEIEDKIKLSADEIRLIALWRHASLDGQKVTKTVLNAYEKPRLKRLRNIIYVNFKN